MSVKRRFVMTRIAEHMERHVEQLAFPDDEEPAGPERRAPGGPGVGLLHPWQEPS